MRGTRTKANGSKLEVEHIAEDTPTVPAEPVKAIEPDKPEKARKADRTQSREADRRTDY